MTVIIMLGTHNDDPMMIGMANYPQFRNITIGYIRVGISRVIELDHQFVATPSKHMTQSSAGILK